MDEFVGQQSADENQAILGRGAVAVLGESEVGQGAEPETLGGLWGVERVGIDHVRLLRVEQPAACREGGTDQQVGEAAGPNQRRHGGRPRLRSRR
jgi:hypothetical protein